MDKTNITEESKKVIVLRQGANMLHASNFECEQHGGNCCAAGYCCNKTGRILK